MALRKALGDIFQFLRTIWVVGDSWGHGNALGDTLKPLGTLWGGDSWSHLVVSLGHFGGSSGACGKSLEVHGCILETMCGSRVHFGGSLVHVWRPLGCLGNALLAFRDRTLAELFKSCLATLSPHPLPFENAIHTNCFRMVQGGDRGNCGQAGLDDIFGVLWELFGALQVL